MVVFGCHARSAKQLDLLKNANNPAVIEHVVNDRLRLISNSYSVPESGVRELGLAAMRISSSLIAHLRVPAIHVTRREYRTAALWAWQARKSVVQYGHGHGRSMAKRQIHIGQALMPPIIFTGLFLALWCYKCIMLVLFQNAIIYNPFLPPNARSMKISEFSRQCGGIEWREDRIKSLDGTEIALCISEISCGEEHGGSSKTPKRPVYVLYFQGMSMYLLFLQTTAAG